MRLHQIDPLQDPRWADLVQKHFKASIFHTVGWLKALQQTYGYTPVVFTTCGLNQELGNGLLFCHVQSWLTGGRMVSLPFSDHCEPLFDSSSELQFVMEYLRADLQHRNWKYIELRPANSRLSEDGANVGFQPSDEYCFHRMDLRPDLHDIFHSLHKDSAQRRIRHAIASGVSYERGRTPTLLNEFYDLVVLTRARHHLPPQPASWFRNLVDLLGESLEIRVAYKDQIPIAAVLTIRFRDVTYYKYGGSDFKFKHFGAVPYLLWKTIEDSKSLGVKEFDLGRSDRSDATLVSFKNRWAQRPLALTYWTYPEPAMAKSWKMRLAKRMFAVMPDRLLTVTGSLIYRHIA